MKKWKMGLLILAVAVVFVPAMSAQSSLKGLSLNGTTGLYNIPSGRISWERSSDFGLDFGYHTIFSGRNNHIPTITVSLLKWVELAGAFDFQPQQRQQGDEFDFIISGKFQLPTKLTAVAIGGNYQHINHGTTVSTPNEIISRNAGQIYLATTFAGNFFSMPAETTVVVGYTFKNGGGDNIDFGMGFDLVLFPQAFQQYAHWVLDFSNYSYSDNPWGADAGSRGCLNTGIRFDLSHLPGLGKYKFVIDIMLLDAFDSDRSFSLGGAFGIPLK